VHHEGTDFELSLQIYNSTAQTYETWMAQEQQKHLEELLVQYIMQHLL